MWFFALTLSPNYLPPVACACRRQLINAHCATAATPPLPYTCKHAGAEKYVCGLAINIIGNCHMEYVSKLQIATHSTNSLQFALIDGGVDHRVLSLLPLSALLCAPCLCPISSLPSPLVLLPGLTKWQISFTFIWHFICILRILIWIYCARFVRVLPAFLPAPLFARLILAWFPIAIGIWIT